MSAHIVTVESDFASDHQTLREYRRSLPVAANRNPYTTVRGYALALAVCFTVTVIPQVLGALPARGGRS